MVVCLRDAGGARLITFLEPLLLRLSLLCSLGRLQKLPARRLRKPLGLRELLQLCLRSSCVRLAVVTCLSL
jgi:hypothetical protein